MTEECGQDAVGRGPAQRARDRSTGNRPEGTKDRHLEAVAAANCVEKVRRAAIALEWLERLCPGLPQSKPGAAGLGIPEI